MRSKVIAAIDNSDAASGVLSVADAVAATLFDGDVKALHVRENGDQRALHAAEKAGIDLRIETGQPVASIVESTRAPEVAAVVVGSRSTPEGPRPAGHTALEAMTSVRKPLLAVPPDIHLPFVLKKLLVPLDASVQSADAARQTLLLGCDSGLDMIVLHVRDVDSLPMFDDHPQHETRAWIDEFVARNCPDPREVIVELRVGSPHEKVLEVTQEMGADLIVLGWAQDLSRGHALTVREALRSSKVPVLLLPLMRDHEATRRVGRDKVRLVPGLARAG